MIARSGNRGDNSQVTRCGIDRFSRLPGAVFQRLPPASNVNFDGLAPISRKFLAKPWEQGAQCFGGIANQPNFHRKTNRKHAGIDVDLHAASPAFLRKKLGIGKCRSNHEQCVAVISL